MIELGDITGVVLLGVIIVVVIGPIEKQTHVHAMTTYEALTLPSKITLPTK